MVCAYFLKLKYEQSKQNTQLTAKDAESFIEHFSQLSVLMQGKIVKDVAIIAERQVGFSYACPIAFIFYPAEDRVERGIGIESERFALQQGISSYQDLTKPLARVSGSTEMSEAFDLTVGKERSPSIRFEEWFLRKLVHSDIGVVEPKKLDIYRSVQNSYRRSNELFWSTYATTLFICYQANLAKTREIEANIELAIQDQEAETEAAAGSCKKHVDRAKLLLCAKDLGPDAENTDVINSFGISKAVAAKSKASLQSMSVDPKAQQKVQIA
jgi:hypothetical protein